MPNNHPSMHKNIHTLRFAWQLSPSYVLLYVLLYLFKSLFPYIAIVYGALIIDALLAHQNITAIMALVYWMISLNLLVGVAIAFLTHYLEAYDQKVQTLLNKKIAMKTFSLAYEQIEDQETMRLVKAAQEGSNSSGGLSALMEGIGEIILGISNTVYSCLLMRGLFETSNHVPADLWDSFVGNPWTALIVFGTVILALGVALPLSKLSSKLGYKAMAGNVEGNRRYGYFYDLCSNYQYGKDIRLFHMQPFIMEAQRNDKYGVNSNWEKYSKKDIAISIVISLFYSLIAFVAYGFLGLKAMYGYLSIGTAVSYAGAVTLLANGLENVIKGTILWSLISNYLDNYFVYLSIRTTVVFGNEKLDEKEPLSIVFSHVSFTYPKQNEKTLDDVSLSIKPNEKLAIVGVNGAGKTTLVKLLCRFYRPDSGEILINGKPLESYDEESCYRLYSVVFQDFKLFSYSIRDNVASSENGNEAKAVESLKKAGIYDRIVSFPKGIDTVLYNKNDETGVEISGGEAQKIAIARALYKDSPLVILDEPTSALDPKSEADIYERFGTLVQNKTAIFISHRMSSTKFCDDIIVIDKGKIVEQGNHKELMSLRNGLYQKMWDAQAQYYK